MPRFECREITGPNSGQTSYSIWDTYAEEFGFVPIVEIHMEQSIAERRCQELSCDENTVKALRWWVESGVIMRKIMRSVRLFCLAPNARSTIVKALGMPLPHPREMVATLLHDWCACMERSACAMYHLYCEDSNGRPGHDLEDAWRKLKNHLREDLDCIEKEFQAWRQAWNEQQDVDPDIKTQYKTLEQLFREHQYDYNNIRYFSDNLKSPNKDHIHLHFFVNEVIAMLVLDQYLLKKLERYVYRHGDIDLDIPDMRIRVRDTGKVHRICSNMPDFKNRCLFVLHVLFAGTHSDSEIWHQIWDRHTPQDYWRYQKRQAKQRRNG